MDFEINLFWKCYLCNCLCSIFPCLVFSKKKKLFKCCQFGNNSEEKQKKIFKTKKLFHIQSSQNKKQKGKAKNSQETLSWVQKANKRLFISNFNFALSSDLINGSIFLFYSKFLFVLKILRFFIWIEFAKIQSLIRIKSGLLKFREKAFLNS